MTTTDNAVNTHPLVWADTINARVANGERVEVNGREVFARFGQPASTWQNGSLSVSVRGRKPGREGTVWVKAGEQFSIA